MFNREHQCEWRVRSIALDHEIHQIKDGAAFVDPRTGIGNLQFLDLQFTKLIGRWNRQREPFTLVLIALAESRGDGLRIPQRAFAHVTRVLSETLRAEDTLCRASENEYAILLANSTAEGAQAFLERARNRIAQEPVRTFDGSRFYRSAAGVAQWQDSVGSLPEMLRLADINLQLFFDDVADASRHFLPAV